MRQRSRWTRSSALKCWNRDSERSLRREVGQRAQDASASFFSMQNYVARLEALAQAAGDRANRKWRLWKELRAILPTTSSSHTPTVLGYCN